MSRSAVRVRSLTLSHGQRLRLVLQNVSHGLGGAPHRGLVMVRVALEGKSGGRVSDKRLQIANGFAALGEQGQVRVPEIVEADWGEVGPLE